MNICVDILYPKEFSLDKCLCQEDEIMANYSEFCLPLPWVCKAVAM